MELLVLDSSFNSVAVIDNYESLIWTERYFEYGDFEIYMMFRQDILDSIEVDHYLWMRESKYLMIIEDIQIASSVEEGKKLIITGRSLESILDRRIIWSKIVLSGSLQNGIQQILNETFINPSITDRKVDNFVFETSTDPRIVALTHSEQFTRTNVYNTIQKICLANNLGFWIYLNNNNQLVFRLFMGDDRTYDQIENPYVVFSNKYENLISSDYSFSKRNYKSVTLIAGEGEDLDRKTTVVGTGTGLDRRELYTDASDISQTVDEVELTDAQYRTQLEQRGKSYLAEHGVKEVFDAVAETNLVFRYGEHFFMGDLVQFVSDDNIQSKVRVVELIRSKSISGVETYPKFSVGDVEEYTPSGTLNPGSGGGGGEEYAPLVHQHVVADISDFLNKVYPIGSIFMSVLSTSPSTLFGGTWVAFAPGRVLVGFNSGETEFNTSEKTGGAKTHTLSSNEMPVHTHVQNSHNHTQDPHNHTQNPHSHRARYGSYFRPTSGTVVHLPQSTGDLWKDLDTWNESTTATNNAATATNQAATAVNQNAGGGAAHNNLQPYITVYMWKRTA
jgi:microcystin-dependent protein